MRRAGGTRFEIARWRFLIPEDCRDRSSYLRNELAAEVVAALEGKRGAPFRRSRHATTWKVRIAGAVAEHVFVKQLDSARGLVARAKAKARAKRSEHVLRISEDLRRDGFGVPLVLLIGESRDTGAEVMVLEEAPGFMLTRWMNPSYRTDLVLRRRILRQLGAEIARLHLTGYIHGDLTPYNIFAADKDQIAISFIDHEGTQKTSRVSINVARNRMRNLVQLGHSDIPGVSRTDKLRVFLSYVAVMGLARQTRRQSLLRLLKMIEQRRRRDHAIKRGASQPAIIAEGGVARG
jgi:tRNA A-37 threonylcarbamoyl transferase component Bud32